MIETLLKRVTSVEQFLTVCLYILGRWIKQVVSYKNIGEVQIGDDPAAECFGLQIGFLCALYFSIDHVCPPNRSKAQHGN